MKTSNAQKGTDSTKESDKKTDKKETASKSGSKTSDLKTKDSDSKKGSTGTKK